jgi:hypothetical protein
MYAILHSIKKKKKEEEEEEEEKRFHLSLFFFSTFVNLIFSPFLKLLCYWFN